MYHVLKPVWSTLHILIHLILRIPIKWALFLSPMIYAEFFLRMLHIFPSDLFKMQLANAIIFTLISSYALNILAFKSYLPSVWIFGNQYIEMQTLHIGNLWTLVSWEMINMKCIPLSVSWNAIIRITFYVLCFLLLFQSFWYHHPIDCFIF